MSSAKLPGAALWSVQRLMPILIGLSLLAAGTASGRDFLVYFGTFTDKLSQGIYVSRLEAESGKLSPPELAAIASSPCFLAVAPNEKVLYAANNLLEMGDRKTGAVSAYRIEQTTGQLHLLNQKPTGGPGTCYVSTDAAGKVLLAANYADGSVNSFQLNADGSIGAGGSYIRHHATSVNLSRQNAPHPHFMQVDPSGAFALACDLGGDTVTVYKIDYRLGTLTEHGSAKVPPGSGARHLVFGDDGQYAYVINEMGCTISRFAWQADSGTLQALETVSALPAGQSVLPSYTAAEVLVRGNHLYATIRGHDSISVFAVNPADGRLTLVQNISSGGSFPRGLGIDPTGRWLLAGNQKGNTAVEFEIDPPTGKISPTGRELKIGSPVDVHFVEVR